MTTLADVVLVGTPAEKLEALFLAFEARGQNARGWQPMRVHRALVEIQADTSASKEEMIRAIAEGGFIDTAVGPWLDLLAWGFFRELRTQARQTIISLRLTDTAGLGPYPLSRPIAVAYPSSATPLYYRAQAGSINVPKSGYVDAAFVAEKVGAVYNVAPGQVTQLSTSAPGVTVTSPGIGTTGSILIQSGADAEIDALLRARCVDKWGLLAQGYTAAKIRALARVADATLERFAVLDPGGLPGICDLYIATSTAPATYPQALTVYNALKDPAKKPVGTYPVRCYPATLFGQALAITLYSDGTNQSVVTDAAARLAGFQSALELGQSIHVSRIVDVLVDVDAGAIGAVITNLVGTELINPGKTDAVVFAPSFTVA